MRKLLTVATIIAASLTLAACGETGKQGDNNSQGSNDQGSNDQGSNDQGSNDQGSNDQGETAQ